MAESRKEFWEIRSRSFPGYRAGESYQLHMLSTMKENAVDFSGKTILDLGCGSGAYTIHFAKEAKHVTALDISEGMLGKIKASAAKENLNNISYICSDWMDYTPQEDFDIVFCSLTPAINSIEAAEKAAKYTKEQLISISFSGQGMTAKTLGGMFRAHKIERPQKGKLEPYIRNWLEMKHLCYQCHNIQGEWETLRSYEDMLANFRDVLEANGYDADENILQDYTATLRDKESGLYKSVTAYNVELIIYNKRQAHEKP